MSIRIKRVHEPASASDGYRVLVDRLWPRGISRERAAVDEWARELAPSDELRRWYGHDPERFDEFSRRYRAELESRRDEVDALRRRSGSGDVTLLFAARDAERSNAAVLADILRASL
jgi:uncharacterized protein YeaO (DUF488 family)